MKPSRRILTRAAIGVIVLLFASAGFISLLRLAEERDRALDLFRTGSWIAVQAEIEALRLIDAVTAYYYDPNTDRQEVLQRFEIFWSRIPLMLEGEEGAIVRRFMPRQDIERIFARLPEIERSIRTLKRGDEAAYRRLHGQLEEMRGALHDMVLKVLGHDTSAEGRQELVRSYTEIFAAFSLVIVCGTLLFVMLLRELGASSRLLERSRRAATEAAEANQSKSRFLAAASHDLRQPLNALSLLLGLLQSRVRETASAELIEKSQESLIRITNQLDSYLDITKLDTGSIAVEPTAVALGPLFRRVAASFLDEAMRKGVRLRVVDSGARTISDAFLLERIVANLVANGVRYTDRGAVLIGCRRREGGIRIDVVDTGPGIPPEHQAAIFDEFFQISNAERAHAEGHGLGLSIVRRLVRLLGHRLELQSAPGRGSRFSVIVAAAPPELQADRGAATPETAAPPAILPAEDDRSGGPQPERVGRLVLIIEDDALIAMSTSLMIEEFGAEAVTAGSAEQALALIREEGVRPRLILADYRLSGRNGIEAIEELRGVLKDEIPACIVTGDIDPSVREEASRRTIGYLSKPITTGELRSVVVGTDCDRAAG